jgi:hypothetical protein
MKQIEENDGQGEEEKAAYLASTFDLSAGC